MASKFIESQILPGVKDKAVKDGLAGRVKGYKDEAIAGGTLLNTNASYGSLFGSLDDTEKVLFSKYIRDVISKGIGTASVKDKMFDLTDVIIEAARKNGNSKLWWGIPFLEAMADYQSFDTGGFTGNSQGFAMLHDKEIVLNKSDTSNFLEAVKITRSFADVFKNFKLPNITPQLAGAGDINLGGIHIERLEGGEKGAETLYSAIGNKLRGLGVIRR